MKAGKRLTRAQKQHLESLGMRSSDWLICKRETYIWTLVHRYTGQQKQIRSERWNV